MAHDVSIGGLKVPSSGLLLIAGPCVIESEVHAMKMARAIAAIAAERKMPYVFKASYDKANRTSIRSFRGPGLTEGLRILASVRREVGVPVLTDIHEIGHAEHAADSVDVLQIPAFLCRQTDLLVAAAKTGKVINIKKGQFVSPWDMRHAVEKVREAGNEHVILTERGSTFGYGNLVVDMRGLAIMQQFAPVVFDATHSVQLPSAGSAAAGSPQQSGGQPEFIPLLARAAVAAGVNGVFVEVHDDPPNAKSDGANALDLKNLPALLDEILAIHSALLRLRSRG